MNVRMTVYLKWLVAGPLMPDQPVRHAPCSFHDSKNHVPTYFAGQELCHGRRLALFFCGDRDTLYLYIQNREEARVAIYDSTGSYIPLVLLGRGRRYTSERDI